MAPGLPAGPWETHPSTASVDQSQPNRLSFAPIFRAHFCFRVLQVGVKDLAIVSL